MDQNKSKLDFEAVIVSQNTQIDSMRRSLTEENLERYFDNVCKFKFGHTADQVLSGIEEIQRLHQDKIDSELEEMNLEKNLDVSDIG